VKQVLKYARSVELLGGDAKQAYQAAELEVVKKSGKKEEPAKAK